MRCRQCGSRIRGTDYGTVQVMLVGVVYTHRKCFDTFYKTHDVVYGHLPPAPKKPPRRNYLTWGWSFACSLYAVSAIAYGLGQMWYLVLGSASGAFATLCTAVIYGVSRRVRDKSLETYKDLSETYREALRKLNESPNR